MNHHDYGINCEHFCGGTPDDERHDPLQAENARLSETINDLQAELDSARRAHDVMIRRGWGVVLFPSGWCIASRDTSTRWLTEELRGSRWPDPFDALIAADEWLSAREARPEEKRTPKAKKG